MLPYSQEGPFLVRILPLLAILLTLANAECFLRCELDSADRSAPPCHSQSKQVTDHCIELHNVTAPVVHADGAAWTLSPEPAQAEPVIERLSPSIALSRPGETFAALPQPLRI